MLTAKELMQPRYKALKSFQVHSEGRIMQLTRGDITDIPENYLKMCPPESIKKLQWWECREPEDMPRLVEDAQKLPYTDAKRRFIVIVSFTNLERTKFRLGPVKLGTGWDFTTPIENYIPVDEEVIAFEYGGRGMGKSAFVKQTLKDHSYDTFLGAGFKQEPGIRIPFGYFSFNPGTNIFTEQVDDLRKKIAPFLLRLKEANEKQCPILKAPPCTIKPQVQVLNISTAVGELCSHILYGGNPLNHESNKQNIADSIGDIAILLDSLSQRVGLSFEQCIQIRFNRLSLKQGNNDPI